METYTNFTISIQTLGGFSITAGDVTVKENDNRSRKAWLLLQYLIAFHKRELSSPELISMLWPDTELSNPGGSLKSLVFRTRKLLSPLPIPAEELLIQQNGFYRWNSGIPCTIDTEELDLLYAKIFSKTSQPEEQRRLCLQALALYQGEFLPNSGSESWVIPINTYYSSLFIRIAHRAMDLAMENQDYEEVIHLCRHVLSLETYDEDTHYNLAYALFMSGNQPAALGHYQSVLNHFYESPGELPPPSAHFTALYKIISSDQDEKETDLRTILFQLSENTPPSIKRGAYCCEYVVFRDLCNVTKRSLSRTGNAAYLCLFSLAVLDSHSIRPQTIHKAMDALHQAISSSLRSGDVFSRYNARQYVLLLVVDSDHSRGRAQQAIERILKQYRTLYPRNDLALEYTLQPLTDPKNNTSNR